MKNLNYKLQRQHLKAFRKALPHVDSIVSQGYEFQVTYMQHLKAFRNGLPSCGL